jgi:hypothetical protein
MLLGLLMVGNGVLLVLLVRRGRPGPGGAVDDPTLVLPTLPV